MPTPGECRQEIEALHDFFVRWYCGTAEQEAFDRVEQALGESFERVGPDGTIHDREAVRDGIRSQYAAHDPGSFDIEIRNVELIESTGEHTLVRYEEWQETPTGTNGRLSTALFSRERSESGADGDEHTVWQYLQETWLEAPE